MNKLFAITITFCLIILIFSSTTAILACEFYFNHQEINAPLGTTGTIAVRVLKEHNIEINIIKGLFVVNDDSFTINGDLTINLPEIPKALANYSQAVTVYYAIIEDSHQALLISSETLFYRFDHKYNLIK